MNEKKNDVQMLAVSAPELMEMLGCGRTTALRIADEAGAVIHVGDRKLYNVSKIKQYIDSVSGQDSQEVQR